MLKQLALALINRAKLDLIIIQCPAQDIELDHQLGVLVLPADNMISQDRETTLNTLIGEYK